MKYHVQTLTISTGFNTRMVDGEEKMFWDKPVILEGLGSGSVRTLDGRLNLNNMITIAQNFMKRTEGFTTGFRIKRGDRYSTAKTVFQFIKDDYKHLPIRQGE